MIIDNLKNAKNYCSLGKSFQIAFNYLKNTDLENLPNGKYEIDGEKIFVSVQDYTTKLVSEGRWEAHKDYADVQFIIKGKEQLGYTDVDTLTPETEYDKEKDIIFLIGEGQFAKAQAGDFLVFYPEDAHMPCISIDTPQYVKKAVVKIKL